MNTLRLWLSQLGVPDGVRAYVAVDGLLVGGEFTVTARKPHGDQDMIEVRGDWSIGHHLFTVSALNLVAESDQVLFVHKATINDQPVPMLPLTMTEAGVSAPVGFSIQAHTFSIPDAFARLEAKVDAIMAALAIRPPGASPAPDSPTPPAPMP